jgi:hypothetical protein
MNVSTEKARGPEEKGRFGTQEVAEYPERAQLELQAEMVAAMREMRR